MKKIIFIALLILATPFLVKGAGTLVPTSWLRDTGSGFVRPNILTDTLRIPSLTSCDTIDTDADGDFTCGTDGGGGAPSNVDYLVGTSDAGLSAEIVVGTSPGGELGGTWASPTLDDSITTTGWVMGTFSGTTLTAGTVNIDLLDGVGAVDMDYGSADITDHTFITDGTGTAEIVLPAGSIDGTEILNDTVALTTDTSGNYVSSATASGGLVLTGTEGGSLGVLLPAATNALSSTITSGSGLELVSAGLTLLQGCADAEILKWVEATDTWDCAADGGGGGSGDITAVGDVASGAAFDGTQGTILTFNDAGGDATIEYDNTNNWFEVSSIFNPSTNDGATLGNATQSWSDLFLASGAVTNWNNGDMTLTHSSNALRFGGGIVGFSDAAPVAVTGFERVQFEDADGSLSDWSFRVAGGGNGTINFAESNGTLASPTVAAEFDTLGEFGFYGHDGTNYEKGAYIRSLVDATPGNNDMPSAIVFATTPDGSATPTTRVKIDNAGNLLANSGNDNVMYDCIELGLDPYSNITTGTRKDSVIIPYAMTVTHVYASLTTGPTGSVATFDINEDTDREGAGAAATILSTKITIDASEYSSQSAATSAVVSDTALAKGSEISFDIDGVGSTTPGNGIHIQVCGPINY